MVTIKSEVKNNAAYVVSYRSDIKGIFDNRNDAIAFARELANSYTGHFAKANISIKLMLLNDIVAKVQQEMRGLIRFDLLMSTLEYPGFMDSVRGFLAMVDRKYSILW